MAGVVGGPTAARHAAEETPAKRTVQTERSTAMGDKGGKKGKDKGAKQKEKQHQQQVQKQKDKQKKPTS